MNSFKNDSTNDVFVQEEAGGGVEASLKPVILMFLDRIANVIRRSAAGQSRKATQYLLNFLESLIFDPKVVKQG